jgi:hypothetical protein
MGFTHCGTRLTVTASNSKPGSADKVLIYDVETLSIISELVDNSEILAVAFSYSGKDYDEELWRGGQYVRFEHQSAAMDSSNFDYGVYSVQLFALFSVDDQRVITCYANTGNNLIF